MARTLLQWTCVIDQELPAHHESDACSIPVLRASFGLAVQLGQALRDSRSAIERFKGCKRRPLLRRQRDEPILCP